MKLLISLAAMVALIGSSLWAIAYPVSPYRLSRTLAKIALILGLALLLIGWYARPALAKVEYLKEADQWIYQSQTVLSDTAGTPWEVTALKQMDGSDRSLSLRIETPSTSVQLDAVEPLRLTTALDTQLTATNITRQQFMGTLPDPNVGQYDLQPLLPELKALQFSDGEAQLTLQLPMKNHGDATLSIPSDIVEEWTLVGSCDYIMCGESANN